MHNRKWCIVDMATLTKSQCVIFTLETPLLQFIQNRMRRRRRAEEGGRREEEEGEEEKRSGIHVKED